MTFELPENAIHLGELDFVNLEKRQKRQRLLQRCGGRCCYCGQVPDRLTLDHVIPRSRGGTESTHNLFPACLSCNQAKGSKHWQSWYRSQRFYCANREAAIAEWVLD